MKKIQKQTGFLGFRTTKEIEEQIKSLCLEHKRSISEILNYLLRIFLEDKNSIRSDFLGEKNKPH